MTATKKTRRGCRVAPSLALLLLAAGAAAAQQPPEIVVPLSNPGQPAFLEVGLVNGSISVSAYDGSEVVIQTSLEADDDEEARSESRDGLKRIPNTSVGLTVEESSNRLEISGDWSTRATHLVIRVPNFTSLNLSTVSNGDIEVFGAVGDHELSNVNGAITAIDVAGSVVANTTNGDVIVRFDRIEPDKPMSFSTWNGDVDLTLPGDSRAKLRMNAGSGDIYTDFDVVLEPQDVKMSREEGESGFRVRLEKEVVGSINGGSTEFRFKTYNGDIYVRKRG